MLTWCWLMRVRRQRHAHWAIAPDAAAAAGVDVLSVEKTQQWETPASVWEYVTGRWPIDFDACASPLNALAPRYETSDGDFLARTDLRGITIFCNPPYSLDRNATGSCGAIERFICKLVEFANSIFIDITRVYCILKSITCILKRIQYNLYLKEYTNMFQELKHWGTQNHLHTRCEHIHSQQRGIRTNYRFPMSLDHALYHTLECFLACSTLC